jgi:hypothetical protein
MCGLRKRRLHVEHLYSFHVPGAEKSLSGNEE